MVMKIHFLNVGHGDCTIIDLPSKRLMMIDINNSRNLPDADVVALAEDKGLTTFGFTQSTWIEGKYRSWEDYYQSLLVDPAEYFKENFLGRSIFRYVQTHPDMDHMSGLHRLFWQDKVQLVNFWDVAHSKEMDEDNFENTRYSHIDWVIYQLLRLECGPDTNGHSIGENHKVIKNLRGASGEYWTNDGIKILSPTSDLVAACNASESYNDCSYVLKISHAGRSVILPGDAESAAWKSILDEPGREALKCDILKASHHGRESGYDEDAVDAMSPEVVICSVGKKPSTDASDEYASHGAAVLSTRYHGTITVEIWDDGDVWITNHKGERIYTIE